MFRIMVRVRRFELGGLQECFPGKFFWEAIFLELGILFLEWVFRHPITTGLFTTEWRQYSIHESKVNTFNKNFDTGSGHSEFKLNVNKIGL